MSLLFIMSDAAVHVILRKPENDTDFEFVFGNFLLKKEETKINLICKETKAHNKPNVRGSFETNQFF